MAQRYPPTTTPLSASVPVTASLVAPVWTPTYKTAGQFSVLSRSRVNTITSTPRDGLDLILDTKTWSTWNTFTPRVKFTPNPSNPSKDLTEGEKNGMLEVGTNFVFDVYMDGKGLVEGAKPSNTNAELVTFIEELKGGKEHEGKKGWRVAWKSNSTPKFLLFTERVLEFVEVLDEDGSGAVVGWDLVTWDTMGGIMALAVKLTLGSTLVDRFGDYARDVKGHFEKQSE